MGALFRGRRVAAKPSHLIKLAMLVLFATLAAQLPLAESQKSPPSSPSPAPAPAAPKPSPSPSPVPPAALSVGCTTVPGQACNKTATVTATCPDGCALSGGASGAPSLSCYNNKCYSFPRAMGEPCVDGQPANACGEGMVCAPIINICLASPRLVDQPCIPGELVLAELLWLWQRWASSLGSA